VILSSKHFPKETIEAIQRRPLIPLKHMSLNFPYHIYEELIKQSNRTGYTITELTIFALKGYLKIK
jgi:hypothetical protein